MASRLCSCILSHVAISAIVLLLSFALIPGAVLIPACTAERHFREARPLFSKGPTYSTEGLFSNSVAVGDFNGDGKLDLVVTNQCEDALHFLFCSNDDQGSVTARLGNGDGTFRGALISNAGNGAAFSVAVGDFNHDSKPDLGVASLCVVDVYGFLFGEVHGMIGNGSGHSATPILMPQAGLAPTQWQSVISTWTAIWIWPSRFIAPTSLAARTAS